MPAHPASPEIAPRTKAKATLARYANYFDVGHNRYEFLIDFGQFDPGSSRVAMHTRMVLGPTQAKLLAQMLQGSVRDYESECGAIAMPAGHTGQDPMAAVLRSLPDFEQRAVAARRRPAAKATKR